MVQLNKRFVIIICGLCLITYVLLVVNTKYNGVMKQLTISSRYNVIQLMKDEREIKVETIKNVDLFSEIYVTSPTFTTTTTRWKHEQTPRSTINSITIEPSTEQRHTNNAPTIDVNTIQYCNPTAIKKKHGFNVDHQDIQCKPNTASDKSCKLAKKLHQFDNTLRMCGESYVVNICTVEEEKGVLKYHCSFNDCEKYDKENVVVWSVNDKTGRLVQSRLYTKKEDLENGIGNIANMTYNDGYGFVLLECTNSDEIPFEVYDQQDVIGQLFIIPPNFAKQMDDDNGENLINVNFVLLDSASRDHFYRSLPKTLSAFEYINENTDAEILDFELFQAINGHTNQNLHALFTGNIFPANTTQNEQNIVDFGAFYKRFAKAGYTTVYHDDLCYDEVWGIRLNLGSPRSWKRFKELLNENHIHRTGLTFSSCKLLSTNGVSSPFNGPDGPLCFNGRFMDAYHLDYNFLRHSSASKNRHKLFTFNMLSVAHDNKGTRIQSIDEEMVMFAKNMAKSSNTLTIILADHGNTYTYYSGAVVEGRFEQYHPSLFIIVPKTVQETFGDVIMKNLRENQFKLTTMIDIHKALITIPQTVQDVGIFGGISNTRTCNDVQLVLPNFCVCKGWTSPMKNDSFNLHLVQFAVGQLNNIIQNSTSTFSKCQFLSPTSYFFVTERVKGEKKIITLDFNVNSGNIVEIPFEHFHVEMESNALTTQGKSPNLKFLTYDRISPYGPYRACVDKNIDIKLCICDKLKSRDHNEDFVKQFTSKLEEPPTMSLAPDVNITITRPLLNNKCIQLKQTIKPYKYEKKKAEIDLGIDFITYEVANICTKGNYKVAIALYGLKNVRTTTQLPFTTIVPPLRLKYLGTVYRIMKKGFSKVKNPKVKAELI